MTEAGQLRAKVELYRRVEGETPLGEQSFQYVREGRDVWMRIVPTGGRSVQMAGGMDRAEITHKATVRESMIQSLDTDMYFMYRGQRYDVLYGYPIYNRGGWLELFCRLVVEDSVPSI